MFFHVFRDFSRFFAFFSLFFAIFCKISNVHNFVKKKLVESSLTTRQKGLNLQFSDDIKFLRPGNIKILLRRGLKKNRENDSPSQRFLNGNFFNFLNLDKLYYSFSNITTLNIAMIILNVIIAFSKFLKIVLEIPENPKISDTLCEGGCKIFTKTVKYINLNLLKMLVSPDKKIIYISKNGGGVAYKNMRLRFRKK